MSVFRPCAGDAPDAAATQSSLRGAGCLQGHGAVSYQHPAMGCWGAALSPPQRPGICVLQ